MDILKIIKNIGRRISNNKDINLEKLFKFDTFLAYIGRNLNIISDFKNVYMKMNEIQDRLDNAVEEVMIFVKSLIKPNQEEFKLKKNEIMFTKYKKNSKFSKNDFLNLSNFSKKVNNLKSMTKSNSRSLSMNSKELRKFTEINPKNSPSKKFSLNGQQIKIPIETFLKQDYSCKKLDIPKAFRSSLYQDSSKNDIKFEDKKDRRSRDLYLTKVDEKLKDECTQTYEDETKKNETEVNNGGKSDEKSHRRLTFSIGDNKLQTLQMINLPRRISELNMNVRKKSSAENVLFKANDSIL
jgi:hypothetical protein